MSLSPSKETFWSQHQETLKQIRGNLKTGKQVRVKSRTLLQNGSTRSRIPQPSAHRAYSRRAKSYTPPYLPRLRTPPEHNVYRSHSSLRGRKYNIVPPVQAKEAFVSESETDSWGEESDTESESIDGQPFPYGIPYAAPPAVIYPGLPGQPLMFHPSAPPQQRHPARKLRSRDRKKQNQKKSVRFSRKPIDTARMKLAQSNPGYQKLYSDLLDSQPNQEDALSRQANGKDLFDENRNPLLQKYKYIYPIERVSSELSRPVLSDIHSNSVNTEALMYVLDVALTEPSRQVCEEIVTEEVDGFLRDLVREATSELVDEYLDVRLASSDPLEEFLTDLLNDGVSLALGVVVKETLQELTDDALIFSGSYDIIDDLMIEELNKTAPELLSEVTLDLTLDELIDDVIRSEIIEESRDIAEEVLTEADNKIKRREFREVSRQAQEKTVDALCLDYLLALVSRQGAIWSESDFANRAMDSMTLSLLLDQYFNVQKERSKTLENVALQRLHEKAVTGVAVDVLLAQLTASLDEDLADVDEYECGVSV